MHIVRVARHDHRQRRQSYPALIAVNIACDERTSSVHRESESERRVTVARPAGAHIIADNSEDEQVVLVASSNDAAVFYGEDHAALFVLTTIRAVGSGQVGQREMTARQTGGKARTNRKRQTDTERERGREREGGGEREGETLGLGRRHSPARCARGDREQSGPARKSRCPVSDVSEGWQEDLPLPCRLSTMAWG
jgi:hypothetical protein